jgi:hypothetical protein
MEPAERYLIPASDCTEDYSHPKLGKPSQVWPYHNANCELLGFICRFDTPDGKQILPRTLWATENAPDGEWLWRGFPEPRPLYGLDRLAMYAGTPVIVCEGEKATDAAEHLVLGHVAVTSPGGSNGAHKADWSALTGRTIIICPDADAPGRKYAETVAAILQPIAASVTIITPPDDAPPGWDAADALKENWSPEKVAGLFATATPAIVATPSATKRSNRSECSSSDWQEPLPLTWESSQPRPYPVEALPPLIHDAVVSYQEYGQQPVALVATSALANVALACQGLADVARDPQLVSPISLSFITIAESGERKTAADKVFSAAASEWEMEKYKDAQTEIEKVKGQLEAHKAKKAGVQNQISKLATDMKKNHLQLETLEAQLEEWDANAPRIPITPSLFYEDVTQEKLAEKLATGWPSAALYSDEAAIVVGGHGFREERALGFFGFLNRLWDGRNFKRDRISAQSCFGIGRRLTCSLMMQISVLRALLGVSDGLSRNTGFMARILLAFPESTMGTREYRPGITDNPHLRAFHSRIRTLLDQPLPVQDESLTLTPPVLTLDAEAHALWIAYYNDTERQLGKLGEYETIKDFAAKSAENAARIAAILHIFEHGAVGVISAGMMQRAIALAAWYLEETKRIFIHLEEPQDIGDARLLQEWALRRGGQSFTQRDVMQYGPNLLRKNQARRLRALEMLTAHHVIAAEAKGSRTIYHINPALTDAATVATAATVRARA